MIEFSKRSLIGSIAWIECNESKVTPKGIRKGRRICVLGDAKTSINRCSHVLMLVCCVPKSGNLTTPMYRVVRNRPHIKKNTNNSTYFTCYSYGLKTYIQYIRFLFAKKFDGISIYIIILFVLTYFIYNLKILCNTINSLYFQICIFKVMCHLRLASIFIDHCVKKRKNIFSIIFIFYRAGSKEQKSRPLLEAP